MKKNKGKYQKEEKKTGKMTEKRKYMSYEDAPLEDYPDDEPAPANLTKRFLKMFLILFLFISCSTAGKSDHDHYCSNNY